MLSALKRELLLFFGVPKNIYLPLSVFSVIFLIFLIFDDGQLFQYASLFIASFITVLIISENTFKDDFLNGYIEKLLCEQSNLFYYFFAKYITQLMFIFIPMLGLNFIFGSLPTGMSAANFSFAYLVFLLTLNFFFQLGSVVSVRRNNSLNALIIIPLLIPFIILVKGLLVDGVWEPNFYFLMAYFIFGLFFINYLTAKVLEIQSR